MILFTHHHRCSRAVLLLLFTLCLVHIPTTPYAQLQLQWQLQQASPTSIFNCSSITLEYSKVIPRGLTQVVSPVEDFDEIFIGQEVSFHLTSKACDLSCTVFRIDFGDGAGMVGEVPCEVERYTVISHVYSRAGEVAVAVLLNSSYLVETSLTVVSMAHACYRFAAFAAEDYGTNRRTSLLPSLENMLYVQAISLRAGQVYDATEEFISLGEAPMVHVAFGGQRRSFQAEALVNQSLWMVNINVPASPHAAVIEIESLTRASVHRCGIATTKLIMQIDTDPYILLSNRSFAEDRSFTNSDDYSSANMAQVLAKDSSPCFNDKVVVLAQIGPRYHVIYSTDAFVSYTVFDLTQHVQMLHSGTPLCIAISCETLELTGLLLLDSGFVVESSLGILFLQFEPFGFLSASFFREPVGIQALRLAKNAVCIDPTIRYQSRFAVYATNENLGEVVFSSGRLQSIDGVEQLDAHVENFFMSDGTSARLDQVFLFSDNRSFVAQLRRGHAGSTPFFAEVIQGTNGLEEVPRLTDIAPGELQAHASGLAVFAAAESELWMSHTYTGSSLHLRSVLRTDTRITSITSCAQSSEFFVETRSGAVHYGKLGSPQLLTAATIPPNAIVACSASRQVYVATVRSGPTIQRSTVALSSRVRNSKRPLRQATFVPSARVGSFLLAAMPFPFQASDTGMVLVFGDTQLQITDVNEDDRTLQVYTDKPLLTREDTFTQNDLTVTVFTADTVELVSIGNGIAPWHVGMTVLALEGAILIRDVWNSSVANGTVVHPIARTGAKVYVHNGAWHLVDMRSLDISPDAASTSTFQADNNNMTIIELALRERIEVDGGLTARFKDNSSSIIAVGTVVNATQGIFYVQLSDGQTEDVASASMLEVFTARVGAFASSLPAERFMVRAPPCSSGTLDVFPQVPTTMLQPLDQSDLLQLVAVTSTEDTQLEFLTSTPQSFLAVTKGSQPGLHGRVLGMDKCWETSGSETTARALTFQGLPQAREGRTSMMLRITDSFTCGRHRSEYVAQLLLGCPRFKQLVYNVNLSIPEVLTKPQAETIIQLPNNYRPPSHLGEAIPLTPNVYNAAPALPLYANRFEQSRASARFKRLCGNDTNVCACPEELASLPDISHSDCIQTAHQVPYKRAFVPRLQVVVSDDQTREDLSYMYTLVDVNGRVDYCTNSSRFDATTCGNGTHIHQFAFDPYANDAILFVGQGLYHFQVALVDAESYCNLTTQFTVFVVNPPLAGPTEAATIAATSIFLGCIIFSAYLYYSTTVLAKDVSL